MVIPNEKDFDMTQKIAWLPLLFLALVGCEPPPSVGQDVNRPYEDGTVVVVTGEGPTGVLTGTENCAPTSAGCVGTKDLGEICKGEKGPADVLYKDGKIIAEICYPEKTGEGGQTTLGKDEAPSLSTNQGRVTFSPDGDGETREGGVQVQGNGNVVYGNGAENTIIKGDSQISGNNNKLRGVTVIGDLGFQGNNVTIALTVVEGNLNITGNNAILADVVVLGDLTITGSNHILMRTFVSGKVSVVGENNQCAETFYFEDADEDKVLAKTEVGEVWTCQ